MAWKPSRFKNDASARRTLGWRSTTTAVLPRKSLGITNSRLWLSQSHSKGMRNRNTLPRSGLLST